MKKKLTTAEQAELTKHTLLTNISFMQGVGSLLRVNCNAILISEGQISFGGPIDTIRGFGTEPSDENFQIWLKKDQLPFTIEPVEHQGMVMLTHDDKVKPIFAGSNLKLADGTTYFIQAEDQDHPLDIFTNQGQIDEVWKTLKLKTAEYWTAPFMPLQQYASAEKIRQLYKEEPELLYR